MKDDLLRLCMISEIEQNYVKGGQDKNTGATSWDSVNTFSDGTTETIYRWWGADGTPYEDRCDDEHA